MSICRQAKERKIYFSKLGELFCVLISSSNCRAKVNTFCVKSVLSYSPLSNSINKYGGIIKHSLLFIKSVFTQWKQKWRSRLIYVGAWIVFERSCIFILKIFALTFINLTHNNILEWIWYIKWDDSTKRWLRIKIVCRIW